MTQPSRTPAATTAAPHTHLPRFLHVSIAALACVTLGVTTLLVAPRPLSAQDAAPTRMTLGGPPPTVRTEADLKAFLDDLETQEFAIYTALGIRDVLPVARGNLAPRRPDQRPLQ